VASPLGACMTDKMTDKKIAAIRSLRVRNVIAAEVISAEAISALVDRIHAHSLTLWRVCYSAGGQLWGNTLD
jgi:hypothetical protein